MVLFFKTHQKKLIIGVVALLLFLNLLIPNSVKESNYAKLRHFYSVYSPQVYEEKIYETYSCSKNVYNTDYLKESYEIFKECAARSRLNPTETLRAITERVEGVDNCIKEEESKRNLDKFIQEDDTCQRISRVDKWFHIFNTKLFRVN